MPRCQRFYCNNIASDWQGAPCQSSSLLSLTTPDWTVSSAAVVGMERIHADKIQQVRALFLEDGDAVRNVVAGNCSIHPSPPCFIEQNYKGINACSGSQRQLADNLMSTC
jgi:hypothetical protein